MDKIELLSPAGDLEKLKIALLYGADAVYIGGQKYSLRANATNFSIKQIKEACSFAHKLDKKVFLTMNMVFHNEDLEDVKQYINDVANAGIDAFIISDLSLIKYIKDNYPNIEVHISTQTSTTNSEGVLFLKNQGVDRVVLAREVSIKEIDKIMKKTAIDIEVFIHGAMCTCYSGRCTLSNYVTNRDANRGGCAQVCRFAFKNDNCEFTMATKDLNMADYISDLIDTRVKSLKVEGRMRSLYYLATVIGSYRQIIDLYYENNLTKEKLEKLEYYLSRVANREVSTHYYLKEADDTDQYYTGRQEISNQDYLGLIKGYDNENKCLILSMKNYFKKDDIVEFFTPNGDIYPYVIDKIYDENMNELEVARHPEQILKLKFEKELVEFSIMRLIKKS